MSPGSFPLEQALKFTQRKRGLCPLPRWTGHFQSTFQSTGSPQFPAQALLTAPDASQVSPPPWAPLPLQPQAH